jgi:hypothetical protein
MQRVRLLALVAAALTIAILAAVIVSRGDRDVSRAPTGQRALPGFADKLGAIEFLRLTHGPVTVNFALVDQRWTIAEKANYPADQERVRELLLQLAELELIESKTDRPELLPRLDLDDPANGKSTEITAQDRAGAMIGQIVIGRGRPSELGEGQAGVYVRKPGSDQAWLARGAFALAGDPVSWLDRRIIDIAPARVASVVLTAADGNSVLIARGSADQPFAIDGLPADAQAKPDAALAAPAGALEALTLDDVKAARGSMDDENGMSTAAFTTFDGLVVGLRLSPPGAGDWLMIDVTGSEASELKAKTLSAQLTPWRFAIPAARAKLLRTTLADLLLPGGS